MTEDFHIPTVLRLSFDHVTWLPLVSESDYNPPCR